MRFVWRWAMLAVLTLGFVNADVAPARADDPVECTFLMPANPAYLNINPELLNGNCVERGRFEVRGHQILIADLEGYRPPDERARLELVRDAVVRSFDYYSRWFTTFDVLFVFGPLPSTYDAETGRSVELADAVADNRSCIISVEAGAMRTGRGGTDPEDVKRTIAHELFHCVQSIDPTLRFPYVQWRDEGTAEYFGALVFPNAPYNNAFGQELGRIEETPLYDLENDAAPFFFYLGAQRGPDAVVNFLRAAGRGRDDAAQAAALRNIPDIDRLFNTFIRAWLENGLTDTRGRTLPIPTPSVSVTPINAEQPIDLGEALPFTAQIAAFDFNQDMAWRIETPEEGATGAWRRGANDWLDLPAIVDACDSRKTGILILTSAAGSTSPVPHRTRVTEQPGEMRECRCPVGSWVMDTEALRTTSPTGTMIPGNLVEGRVTLTFLQNGTAYGVLDHLVYGTAIDANSVMQTTIHGNITWTWRRRPSERTAPGPSVGPSVDGARPGTERLLLERTITRAEGSSFVEFFARGRSAGPSRRTPWQPGQAGGSVSVHEAYCDDEGLHILPNPRLPSASGAPWHGLYRRGG